MILTCPACGTQYVVKDGAIPDGGRKVRCAACRHSWHQEPPPLELEEPIELEAAVEAGDTNETDEPQEPAAAEEYSLPEAGSVNPDNYEAAQPKPFEEAPVHQFEAESAPEPGAEADFEPRSSPHYDTPRAEEARAAVVPVSGEDILDIESPREEIDDDFSPFAAREPGERKRRSPIVMLLLVVLLVAALAAAFWFLAPPAWKARVGLTNAGQTPLQLMMTHSDRQLIAPGNSESLAVSGRIINPTTRSQRVPPIRAELRSSTGKIVYRWTIAPPVPSLAPGASASFNSTEVNIPSGGEELTVSLGPPAS